jgi:plastocyanin
VKLRDYGLAGGGLAFAAVALVWVSSAPAGAAGHHVEMEGYAYSPRSLTVQRGDSVTWMNHDEAPHDSKTTSGPASFHSPLLNKGESWSHTFNTAGTYSYYCTVHPDMKASITVSAPKPLSPKPSPKPPPTKSKEPEPEREPEPEPEEATTSPTPKRTSKPAPTVSAPPATTSPPAPPPTPTVVAAVPQPGSGSALSPLLLVSGLVTAVAVFCLLALASRKQVGEETPR